MLESEDKKSEEQESEDKFEEVFAGLKVLAEGAFPKECSGCGKVYDTLEEFVENTSPVDSSQGLKEAGGALKPLIEMSRLCECGTGMTAQCEDRRAHSALGLKRRDLFEHLLSILSEGGMPRGMAKSEILKVMRGEGSNLLSKEQLQRFFS